MRFVNIMNVQRKLLPLLTQRLQRANKQNIADSVVYNDRRGDINMHEARVSFGSALFAQYFHIAAMY